MNFRTDLTLERRDLYKKANGVSNEISGVETQEKTDGENIRNTKVKIINKQGEEALDKPIGTYITIDIKNLKIATEEDIERAAINLNTELKEMLQMHVKENEDILVVGLGNLQVTPDSLGPKVVQD